MKLSKLLQMLLGVSNFFQMGIVEEGQGGNADDDKDEDGDQSGKEKAEGDDDKSKEKDEGAGKKPSDEEAKLLKELMGKKATIKTLQDDLAAAKTKLKEFDGLDVNAIKKLLQDNKDAETQQLEAKGEWDRLKQRMIEEHTNAVKTVQEQLTTQANELQTALDEINNLSVGGQFGQSQYIADELLLTPNKAKQLYASHFEYKDGQVIGYDKPKGAANRTQFVDGVGTPLSFDAVMAKLIDADPDRDALKRAKGKKGAGSDSQGKAKSENGNQEEAKTVFSGEAGLSKIAAGLASLSIS